MHDPGLQVVNNLGIDEDVSYFNIIDSPIGPVSTIVDGAGRVLGIRFQAIEATAGRVRSPRQTAKVDSQLREYFARERQEFDLDLLPKGSEFQLQVWQLTKEIPYGQTRSYGQLARAIGDPGASRAVGQAMGANPIPIIIPCHRVIGTSSNLVGFGGGLTTKELLLRHEEAITASLFED